MDALCVTSVKQKKMKKERRRSREEEEKEKMKRRNETAKIIKGDLEVMVKKACPKVMLSSGYRTRGAILLNKLNTFTVLYNGFMNISVLGI